MSTSAIVAVTALVTSLVLMGFFVFYSLWVGRQQRVVLNAIVMFATYCIDVGCALVGFVYGFGIEVKSWWWVLGMMFLGRFLLHTLNSAARHAFEVNAKKEGE